MKKRMLKILSIVGIIAIASVVFSYASLPTEEVDAANYTGTGNQTLVIGDTWSYTFTAGNLPAGFNWLEGKSFWSVSVTSTLGNMAPEYFGLTVTTNTGSLYAYYNSSQGKVVMPTLTISCKPTVAGTYYLNVVSMQSLPMDFLDDWQITFTVNNPVSYYTIAYNANGGSTAAQTQSVIQGQSINIYSSPPFWSGHTFTGWKVGTSSTILQPGQSYRPTSNVTLVAQWIDTPPAGTTYRITYDANGGQNAPDVFTYTTTNTSQEFTISSQIPTRAGFNFVKWNSVPTSGDVSISLLPGDKHVMSSWSPTLMLLAEWSSAPFPATVKFNVNGGNAESNNLPDRTIMTGTTITLPSVGYTRSGYYQSGWAEGSSTGTVFSMGQSYVVHNNITMYAVWTELPTAFFDNNAPSVAMVGETWSYSPSLNPAGSTPYALYNELQTFIFTMVNPPTGFKFTHTFNNLSFNWIPSAAGVYMIEFYMAGDNATIQQATRVMFKITVYAKDETPDTNFTISFNPNNGSGSALNYPGQMPNSAFQLLSGGHFMRQNFTQVGWYANINGSQAVFLFGSYITVKENVIFYAYWIANPNIVIFDANGADGGAINPFIAYTNGQISLPSTGITRTGYSLEGWYLQSDTDAIYPPGYVYTVGDSVTFYAYWIADSASKVSLTVDSNGGTGGYVQLLEPGKKAVLPIAGIQKSGELLQGFDPNISAPIPGWLPGSTYQVDSNSTVYAIWIDNSDEDYYTVYFNLNGGSGSIAPQHILSGGLVIRPATDPIKTASIFRTWHVQNGPEWDFSTPVTSNMTLMAEYDTHFTLTQKNLNITLQIRIAGSSTITWGDGNEEVVTGTIAGHDYENAMTGTITVTTTTIEGVFKSSSPFAVSPGEEENKEEDGGDGIDWKKIAILIFVGFVLLLIMFFGYIIGGPTSLLFTIPINLIILVVIYRGYL